MGEHSELAVQSAEGIIHVEMTNARCPIPKEYRISSGQIPSSFIGTRSFDTRPSTFPTPLLKLLQTLQTKYAAGTHGSVTTRSYAANFPRRELTLLALLCL